MNKDVSINGIGNIKLDSSNYKASGGQADIFVVNGKAIKVYHDSKLMIPVEKIKELKAIRHPNVLSPQEIVFEKSNPVGYMTDFKKDCYPLCQLFTKSFKNDNNISNEQINNLVVQMQSIVKHIHKSNCLVVDLNEMNVLVDKGFSQPFFIDTDSYKTPSYKADAIMESIRDPQIKNNKWTEESDWFSFAIITFYLWVGIHPYRGGHPNYKPKDWIQRMKDGVSVFDPQARLPKPFRDFSMIPASHIEWFKKIFLENKRISPPELGDISGIVSVGIDFQIDISDGQFDIELLYEYQQTINTFYRFCGVPYWTSHDGIYKDNVKVKKLEKSTICKLVDVGANTPVSLELKNNLLYCYDLNGNSLYDPIYSEGFFVKNNKAYSVHQGKMTEVDFRRFAKISPVLRNTTGVMKLSTNVFDGVVIQSIFGEMYFVVVYEKNNRVCVETTKIPELKEYRVIDAKMEENICVVHGERKGKYDRFVFSFDEKDYSKYSLRVDGDITLGDVSFTVLPNGVVALATESTLEIFKGSGVKVVNNPPFSNNNKLFNILGTVHYIDDNKIYKAKMKQK